LRLPTINHGAGILRLTGDQGQIGFGEASPLPGFSPEPVEKALDDLMRLRHAVVGSSYPVNLEELSGGFERWLGRYHLSASARFAFESAVLSMAAAGHTTDLRSLLSDSPRDTVTVNGLLAGSDETVLDEAHRLKEQGYRSLKLKVGRADVDQDIALVRLVREMVGPEVSLRLDANRAWTREQAMRFSERVRDAEIEYIEEPTHTLEEFRRLGMSGDLPLALDESLLGLQPTDLRSFRSLRAVVVKPTGLGVERAAECARIAASAGALPVVTSCFESGVGVSILAQFATSLTSADIPVGLDTLRWFKSDILPESPIDDAGRIDLTTLSGERFRPDIASLEEVTRV